jgi:hypothetical protein
MIAPAPLVSVADTANELEGVLTGDVDDEAHGHKTHGPADPRENADPSPPSYL